MSTELPEAQAKKLAQTYLMLEDMAMYYVAAGYPAYVTNLKCAMERIGTMLRTGGWMKHDSRGGSREFRTRNLVLSLTGGSQGGLA